MSFAYSENQRLLQESAGKFLETSYTFQSRQSLLADGTGFTDAHWHEVAEMGWLAAPFGEAVGGLGFSISDTAAIHEAIGAGLFVSPYLSSVFVAGKLIEALAASDLAVDLLAPVVAGQSHLALAHVEHSARYRLSHVQTRATETSTGFTLSGTKSIVPWAEKAETLLVTARLFGAANDEAGLSVFLVDKGRDGLEETPFGLVDGHRASKITFDEVAVPKDALLGSAGDAFPILENVIDAASIASCAEAVGCMTALHDMTLDYLKQREQFGRPIGKFQVLQHRMVDINMQRDTARAMLYGAAQLLDRSPDNEQRQRLVSAAKAQCGWSGKHIAQDAVQLHGGIGMTNDLPIGHYFKRLGALNTLFGDASHHVRRVAALDDFAATA